MTMATSSCIKPLCMLCYVMLCATNLRQTMTENKDGCVSSLQENIENRPMVSFNRACNNQLAAECARCIGVQNSISYMKLGQFRWQPPGTCLLLCISIAESAHLSQIESLATAAHNPVAYSRFADHSVLLHINIEYTQQQHVLNSNNLRQTLAEQPSFINCNWVSKAQRVLHAYPKL